MTLSELDTIAFQFIHAAEGTPDWIILAATVLAKGLIYGIPLHLLALFVSDSRSRQVALTIGAALVLGIAVSWLTGLVTDRPRPFVAGVGEAWMSHRGSPAFPSNHALVFSAYATCLMLLGRRALGGFAMAGGLLVGMSRVYLGVHYPGDIVAGMIVGAIAGATAASVPRNFANRQTGRPI